MTSFLAQFGQQLADRWVSLLAIPGLLYIAACFAAAELGQKHAIAPTLLLSSAGHAANQISKWSATVQAMTLATLILGSAAISLVVQSLIGPVRVIAFGNWPRILRPAAERLTRRRQEKWNSLLNRRRELDEHDERTSEQEGELSQISTQMNAISLAEPKRPTWLGDQMHALNEVAINRHGLDLTFGWPRVWLILPEDRRAEISAVQAEVTGSLFTIAWCVPYLALAIRWWPTGVVGLLVALVGRSRLRGQIGTLTSLVEAALDLHGRELAVALGAALPNIVGPLTPEEGNRLTLIIRKGR